MLSNKNIFFWGCNSIFINIYGHLKNDLKKKIKLFDENSINIKSLQISRRKKLPIFNPEQIDEKKIYDTKFIICAISWSETIQKKIIAKGISKKNIIIPKI